MRKNIFISALVCGVSGLTFGVASADVVLSGRLIGAFENIRASGNNVDGNGELRFRPRTRLNEESSFVRISGREDLGGGVQAGFQIESGLDISGGNASGTDYTTVNSGNTTRGFGTRSTGVYFQGGFGKIVFGRWEVFYDTIYLVEPDRKSLPNKISLLSIVNTPTGGKSGFDSNVGDRYNNVLSYYTPKFYGLQLQLSYVPTNESSTLGVTYNGHIYGGTLLYKPDYLPLTVMAAGFQQKANATATAQGQAIATAQGQATGAITTDYNLTAWRLGAVWKFPLTDAMSLHVGALYQPSRLAGVQFAGITDRVTYKRTSWGIPLALSIGANTIYATYGYNSKLKKSDETQADTSANFYMLGYNYDLSKRTALGVYYARISNKSQAGYDYYINEVDSAYGIQSGAVPIAVGISFRHLF